MSTPPIKPEAELDALLARLPLASAPSPLEGHVDDGELLAYRAGGLDDARAAAVDVHLAACLDCRDLLAGLAEPAPVLPLPGSVPAASPISLAERRARRVGLGGGLAAAAAILFAFLTLSRGPVGVEAALAPEYVVRSVSGGLAEVRGAAAEGSGRALVVAPNTRVRVVLEPKADLAGPAPRVAAYTSREGGALVALPAGAVETGAGGAVKIEGLAEALFAGAPGEYTLEVALGAGAAGLEGLAPGSARAKAAGVRWVTIDVESKRAPE